MASTGFRLQRGLPADDLVSPALAAARQAVTSARRCRTTEGTRRSMWGGSGFATEPARTNMPNCCPLMDEALHGSEAGGKTQQAGLSNGGQPWHCEFLTGRQRLTRLGEASPYRYGETCPFSPGHP